MWIGAFSLLDRSGLIIGRQRQGDRRADGATECDEPRRGDRIPIACATEASTPNRFDVRAIRNALYLHLGASTTKAQILD
jgi:hypothetical protein